MFLLRMKLCMRLCLCSRNLIGSQAMCAHASPRLCNLYSSCTVAMLAALHRLHYGPNLRRATSHARLSAHRSGPPEISCEEGSKHTPSPSLPRHLAVCMACWKPLHTKGPTPVSTWWRGLVKRSLPSGSCGSPVHLRLTL